MNNFELPVTVLRICVDILDMPGNRIQGRLYGVAVEKEKLFAGSQDLMLLIDKTLDEIGKPQASRKIRSFSKTEEESAATYTSEPKRYHTSEEIRRHKGRQLTWDINFTSRLKSSWQGFVKDDRDQMVGEFESEMELVDLFAGV